EHALTRFTAADLFANAEIRRHTIIAFLLSLTTTLAWWAISSWLPPYVVSLAAKANLPPQQWAAYAGMAYNFGGVLGYICLGFLADWIGRRPTAMLYFAMALLMTPVFSCGRKISICCCLPLQSTRSSPWDNFRGCRCGCRSCFRRARAAPALPSCSTRRASSPSSARCSPAR